MHTIEPTDWPLIPEWHDLADAVIAEYDAPGVEAEDAAHEATEALAAAVVDDLAAEEEADRLRAMVGAGRFDACPRCDRSVALRRPCVPYAVILHPDNRDAVRGHYRCRRGHEWRCTHA